MAVINQKICSLSFLFPGPLLFLLLHQGEGGGDGGNHSGCGRKLVPAVVGATQHLAQIRRRPAGFVSRFLFHVRPVPGTRMVPSPHTLAKSPRGFASLDFARIHSMSVLAADGSDLFVLFQEAWEKKQQEKNGIVMRAIRFACLTLASSNLALR